MNEFFPTLRYYEIYAYNETVVSPIGMIFTILMGILVLTVNKKYVLFPLIAVALYITIRQRVVIFGLDFDMIRIIIIFLIIRIIYRSSYKSFIPNHLDYYIIFYTLFSLFAYTLLWKTFGAFINRLGLMFTSLGVYFTFRIFLNSFDDITRLIKGLILLSIPVALAMVLEQINGRNLFSVFGGVPEFTFFRGGRLRSQAAFSHPILAGSYGAFLFPLSYGIWVLNKKKILLPLLGCLIGILMTLTSSSSGPILSFIAGIFAISVWIFRKYIRFVVYSSIGLLIILHFIMSASVWALIARINVVGGSTGYHRYQLIDMAIKNFTEWALLGTKSTASWGWGLQDITNMYILVGVNGGIINLLLFMTIIIISFKIIGKLVKDFENYKSIQKYIWAIGASFFTHIVSFMGVSYFGQIIIFFYLSIAIISSINDLRFGQYKLNIYS